MKGWKYKYAMIWTSIYVKNVKQLLELNFVDPAEQPIGYKRQTPIQN